MDDQRDRRRHQTDGDADGFGEACDCDDSYNRTYPGAPEVNDGLDNQCPGDLGYGVIDETSGSSGFFNPNDRDEYSWPAQTGAASYQVARATARDFGDCFTFFPTLNPFFVDTDLPLTDQVFYYLNRPLSPNAGSWGQSSDPAERTLPCAP